MPSMPPLLWFFFFFFNVLMLNNLIKPFKMFSYLPFSHSF